jgi:hypothetical protein
MACQGPGLIAGAFGLFLLGVVGVNVSRRDFRSES